MSSVVDIAGHFQHAGDFTRVTFDPGIISAILAIYLMDTGKARTFAASLFEHSQRFRLALAISAPTMPVCSDIRGAAL